MRKVKLGNNEKESALLAPTMFAVAPKYIVTTDNQGARIIEESPEWEERYPEGYRYYSPLEVGCIYSHFATIKDEKSLLKFVMRFGLLGIYARKEFPLHLAGQMPVRFHGMVTFDYVNDVLQEAKTMRDILCIQARSQEGIPLKREVVQEYVEELWPEWWEILKNTNEVVLTRAYLALRASSKIAGVRPVANFTPEGDLVPGFSYFSLYDAIWHQFYMDLTEQAIFKQCPACKSWHTGSGKFCPAPPFYKRSPCENTFNQKKFQNKKKKKGGQ